MTDTTSEDSTPGLKPGEGRCKRCTKIRQLFDAKEEWGKVPSPLCVSCWSRYAVARDSKTFVDMNDAFDNATDEELNEGL